MRTKLSCWHLDLFIFLCPTRLRQLNFPNQIIPLSLKEFPPKSRSVFCCWHVASIQANSSKEVNSLISRASRRMISITPHVYDSWVNIFNIFFQWIKWPRKPTTMPSRLNWRSSWLVSQGRTRTAGNSFLTQNRLLTSHTGWKIFEIY